MWLHQRKKQVEGYVLPQDHIHMRVSGVIEAKQAKKSLPEHHVGEYVYVYMFMYTEKRESMVNLA